jgi:hypothetical protein
VAFLRTGDLLCGISVSAFGISMSFSNRNCCSSC